MWSDAFTYDDRSNLISRTDAAARILKQSLKKVCAL